VQLDDGHLLHHSPTTQPRKNPRKRPAHANESAHAKRGPRENFLTADAPANALTLKDDVYDVGSPEKPASVEQLLAHAADESLAAHPRTDKFKQLALALPW
jgi:hypothetical protein